MIQDYSEFETIILANLDIKWSVFLFTIIFVFLLYWMIIAWSALSSGTTSSISPFLNKIKISTICTSIIKNLNILPLSFEIETLKILQVADSSSSGRETQRLCLWSLRGMQISFDHDHKYSPLFIPYCWLLYDYQHNIPGNGSYQSPRGRRK